MFSCFDYDFLFVTRYRYLSDKEMIIVIFSKILGYKSVCIFVGILRRKGLLDFLRFSHCNYLTKKDRRAIPTTIAEQAPTRRQTKAYRVPRNICLLVCVIVSSLCVGEPRLARLPTRSLCSLFSSCLRLRYRDLCGLLG